MAVSPRYSTSINLTDLPAEFHGANTLASARKEEKHWAEDQSQKETQVQKLHDAWQGTQIRSFTMWINFQLRQEGIKVADIAVDLSTGVVLAALLTNLAEEPVKVNKNPRMRIHYLENVSNCLKFMKDKGIKLVNISSEEIVDKNIKIVLGCVWSMIRKFKIEGLQEEDAAGNDALLLWVQRKVKDYGIRVHNFHTSFQSGLALAAIIHSTYPNILNYHKIPRENPSAVLEQCFAASEKHLDIPRMLEVTDLVGLEKPDDHSVMTYISAHYQVQQQTKDWLTKYNEELPTIRDRLNAAISKLGEPIRVNARDELVKLISQFADDCANSYNKITENYNQLDKIIHSLEKMGLPVSEFDPSPFDEIKRLHNNMTKLITQRKQDLSYADEFLKDAESFLSSYVTRVKDLDNQLTEIERELEKLPADMDHRLAVLRAHSDTLASQKRTLEELAHIKGRLEEKKVTFPADAPNLTVSNVKWENLSRRVKELLDTLQLSEYKLKQYAKDATILNAWIDKVSLQLENLMAAADSVLDPGTSPNQDELRSLVDQYSILNAVYTNKKKDYAKIKELVESIKDVGLKETAYTPIAFEDLTVKWSSLDGKFRPVAAKMGIADEKINVSEKCTKLIKELDDFIINEDKLIKARAARKINDNKEFEALLAEIEARPAIIAEKQKSLKDEDFVLEVPPETTAALAARLAQLVSRIGQEREELLKRKADAENYATKSRELDTWFNGAKENCTPADKPVASVDAAQKEVDNINHYHHGQIAEHARLKELAKVLNDRNIVENIFGGVPLAVLAQHWSALEKAYEERKKFLGASVEQLEITGNMDGVLARERKYLEASHALQFQSKKDFEQDAEGLKKHRQIVAECVTKVKSDSAVDPSLAAKATQLLADYDAEIARKQKVWEALQAYANSAEEILLFISNINEQVSSDALQKYATVQNGNTQFETLVNTINTEKIPPKNVSMVELEGLVAQIKGLGQKETVIYPHSFEEVQEKWKTLLAQQASIKEHSAEFFKLAAILINYSEKLRTIRTEKLDDKKSTVLKRYSGELQSNKGAFEHFASKPVLGKPTHERYLNLVGDYESNIANWIIEEEKLDAFLVRAAKFESEVIGETNRVEDALAEVGRNLVAEYQHFLEEFWALQTQYKDLGDTADALKALDPTTRAESRYAEITEKWDELQAVLERMKKRIQRGYTPEAEVLRAKAYIGELRGPKFAAPEPDRSAHDPAMDTNVVRICLLGEPVGKTAIISKFVKDIYPDVHVHTTSDVHTEGLVELGDKKIRVDILDTNSSENQNSAVRKNWYTWADAFMFVYSMNNLKSFDSFYSSYTQMKAQRGNRPYGLILVANESDNAENREVPSLHGKSAALTMLCKYFEVSAKTGDNVALAFRELLKETAIKKAVHDRVEHEKFLEQQKLVKSKSKNKSKQDINEATVTHDDKSLTADANIDWRVVRLNQLMVLYELQKDVSNRVCADCGRENPDWVARGFMVLLCVQCAHIHKMLILNPRIPKPRNLLMEGFTQKEIVEITALCNGRANMVLERLVKSKGKVKPKPEDSREVKVAWIKAKYISHEYYMSMNNEINNKSFQFQNQLSKKFARDKVITYRTPNDKAPHVRLTGPKSNTGNEVVKGDFFAASAISTFPVGDVDESEVDGGDIVDRWGLDLGKNHLFACVADGCGWGASPAKSAKNATDEFLTFVDFNFNKISTVDEASSLLLNSILVAHDSTTKDLDAKSVINYWEVGTTAFLGGMMVYEKKEQGFVCVSIGNCKAYMVKLGGKALKVADITAGSRDYTLNEDDPGGCIGPQQEAGAPDLRNLQIFYSPLDIGDVVVLMTDGVYQNYDPEYLGLAPRDIDVKYQQYHSWKEMKPKKVQKLKDRYICSMMERTIEKAGAKTPYQIEQTLLEHAKLVTIPRRAFMEREGKTPPPSYVSYPGRLDHTTVCCFSVQREYPNFNV